MIKFWWIMKRNTIHSCYYITALGKLRAQCNVWTWYQIFFYYCLQFSTQVYQNITVLLGHIKTMKPSRCWLDVCDLIFYEKSNFQKYTFGKYVQHLKRFFACFGHSICLFVIILRFTLVTQLICCIILSSRIQ